VTVRALQVARMLRRDRPEIGVVLLSQFADPQYGISWPR
jgi:hypothetical protein